jgi:large subunit ribosomal protein L1
MPKFSKKSRADQEKQPEEALPLEDAITRLKEFDKRNFDQTIDLCIRLGIDARQADQAVRGSLSLPKGIGRTKRVIAFVPDEKVEAAKGAGAVEAGGEDLVKKVQDGWTDFDVAVASPDMMRLVGRLGRVLGPQGKMPSPKSGTVTADVESAVQEYAAGKIEYRNDSGGNVHCIVGRFSFSDDDILENVQALLDRLQRAKPSTAKGLYLRGVWLSGTMTPSVRIQTDRMAG